MPVSQPVSHRDAQKICKIKNRVFWHLASPRTEKSPDVDDDVNSGIEARVSWGQVFGEVNY